MSSAFIQTGLNSSTTIVIAVVVLVLAVGLMVFLFTRSSKQRQEREARVRERMLEMEREAQFAAAVNRVPISRDPADVALNIARLLREYVSLPVLAVYAGHTRDISLTDVLSSEDSEGAEAADAGLPSSIPASLLEEHAWPAIVNLSAIAGPEPVSPPVIVRPAPDPAELPSKESVEAEQFGESQTAIENQGPEPVGQIAEQRPTGRSIESVLLLPWRGPFGWNGFIVATKTSGISLEAIDPFREPLTRLSDRLAVALEFGRSDGENEASHQRASRTTEFSRALVSCLEEASPLDGIVREVTKLVGSDSAALWRVDDANGMVRMVAAHGLKSPEFLPLPVGQGLAGNVAQSGEALALEDAPGDARCIFPREARESGIASYLGAPLSANKKMLGVIEVHSASRRSWTDSDRRALESAASIIAELVKSTDSRGNRLRVESAYLGLSESLQRLRSAEEIQEAVIEVLGHALGASRVIVVEFDDKDQPVPITQEYRQPSAKSALGTAFGAGLFAAVAAAPGGQPIAIEESQTQSLAGAETAAVLGVLSELAAPIRVDGKTRSFVYVHQCDRVREWDQEEIEFAERVVRQLSLSLSNLRSLHVAFDDARQARAEAKRALEISSEAPARIRELERTLEGVGSALAQSRSAEEQVRAMLANASALEAKARAEVDASRRVESEAKQQLERLQEEHKQSQGSAQQLLEINRLKSEFIVNAGHEMEASLQSVMGLAELLERGSYGALTAEQREAVHGIYGWARRIKSDIDWLIEYGSARSRRLEQSGGS